MRTRFHVRPSVADLTFELARRPIHPEFFDILAARRIRRADFALDLWLTRTGHAITWRTGRSTLMEITSADQRLPEAGQIMRRRLWGEHCDMVGDLPDVNYQVSFQVEQLTEEQFVNVHQEILADGNQRGLLHAFPANHRMLLAPIGSIQVESWEDCLALPTFHTFPDELAIVKTQSLFERR